MCDCTDCCFCCGPYKDFIVGFSIGIGILIAVVLIVVLALGYGKVFHVKVSVDDASLTRFSLNTTPVTALSYNLTLSLTIHNPNWAMSIKYKSLEADYLFDDERFDRVQVVMPGYVQPARKTSVYHLSSGMDGAYVALGNAGIAKYKKESATGVFDVEVDLTGEIRYKLHITWCKLEVKCPLKLQLATPGTGSVVFQKTKCEVLNSSQKGC